MSEAPLELFLVCPPGLEPVLAEEARALGFAPATPVPGGVVCEGGWSEVWRANLALRGASRVLVRIGSFRAMHLAQLDKRARKFPWGEMLRSDLPIRVEVTCRRSKIYHDRAARQRIETALREELGAPISAEAGLTLKVRIEDDLVTLSLDTSGEGLHKRGHKSDVGKAPMRETLAALFLRACGYDGQEPVYDPMCGSGTFPIEAAEIARGLLPGRSRSFAFEDLASVDPDRITALKEQAPRDTDLRFYGSDRDQGAVRRAEANAERAGVGDITSFEVKPVSDITPPEGPPGLVIVNPPYGARIGNRKLLFGLYGAFGGALKERFRGWRVGLVTSDDGLARATGLKGLTAGPPVPHGGLSVKLWQAGPL
ncbi:THUMP domain-containing class I SAM-dependent RNA methyltransferase [Litorisediminicola beolgyonensis]|uniref:Class I SAM-dependent RNA methyltransferase n=1 Tax=Litorisediminicola beolgyonensis TaxID=1173614 RepID=A0ABW3ZG04_9RHOB